VNFDLSEDEEMLKALTERFVLDHYDADQRRAALAYDRGFSDQNWRMLGDLGLIGALFDADAGGLGVGPVGLATIFEALGQGLVVEPLIESIVVAGGLFAAGASNPLKEQLLGALVTGEKRLALAHREQNARRSMAWVETRISGNGSGLVLSGQKALVPSGEGVDAYIVSARTSGAPGDAEGVGLYLVDANAPGVSVQPWRLVDGSVAVKLSLDHVCVPTENCLRGGLDDIEAAYDRAALLSCAEALGIMEKIYADTLDYLRTRRQFGASLGSFQALQHRMVAQYAVLEQSRALLYLAMMADATDRKAWSRAVHGARAYIAEASVTFGHEMIQMHGGMGVTDELIIGHGHKRLLMLSRWPEDATASLDRCLST
jgi:alkylation response protein AidB-like acyl-CoA dehydrogenase